MFMLLWTFMQNVPRCPLCLQEVRHLTQVSPLLPQVCNTDLFVKAETMWALTDNLHYYMTNNFFHEVIRTCIMTYSKDTNLLYFCCYSYIFVKHHIGNKIRLIKKVRELDGNIIDLIIYVFVLVYARNGRFIVRVYFIFAKATNCYVFI